MAHPHRVPPIPKLNITVAAVNFRLSIETQIGPNIIMFILRVLKSLKCDFYIKMFNIPGGGPRTPCFLLGGLPPRPPWTGAMSNEFRNLI